MNYTQKQQAMVKLAQVRLAINHVIRKRAMSKQAAGPGWGFGLYQGHAPVNYGSGSNTSKKPVAPTAAPNDPIGKQTKSQVNSINKGFAKRMENQNQMWGLPGQTPPRNPVKQVDPIQQMIQQNVQVTRPELQWGYENDPYAETAAYYSPRR